MRRTPVVSPSAHVTLSRTMRTTWPPRAVSGGGGIVSGGGGGGGGVVSCGTESRRLSLPVLSRTENKERDADLSPQAAAMAVPTMATLHRTGVNHFAFIRMQPS